MRHVVELLHATGELRRRGGGGGGDRRRRGPDLSGPSRAAPGRRGGGGRPGAQPGPRAPAGPPAPRRAAVARAPGPRGPAASPSSWPRTATWRPTSRPRPRRLSARDGGRLHGARGAAGARGAGADGRPARGLRRPGVAPAPAARARSSSARGPSVPRRACRQELRKRGHWAARVSLDEAYDPRTARMDLTFRVEAGPLWQVAYEGAALPEPGLADDVRDLAAGGRGRRRCGGGGGRAHRELLPPERPPQRARDRPPQPARWRGHARLRGGGRARRARWSRSGCPARPKPRPAWRRFWSPAPPSPCRTRCSSRTRRTLQRALEERGHAEAKVEVEVPEGAGNLPVVFRIRAGPRTAVATRGDRDARARCPRPASRASCACASACPIAYATWPATGRPCSAPSATAAIRRWRSRPRCASPRTTPRPTWSCASRPASGWRWTTWWWPACARTREEVVRRELLLKEGEPLGLAAGPGEPAPARPPWASSSG